MKILIADAFDPSLPARLKTFGEITETMDDLKIAEVMLVRSKTKCTKELIGKADSLKLIIRGGVGLDNIDMDAAKARGIKVQNTPSASSVAVAELAIALMLSIVSRVVEAHNGMVNGKFLKKEIKRTELYKKTLGLVGIGRIGREVAVRAKAFGMDVNGFDKVQVPPNTVDKITDLNTLYSTSDILSLHVPLTDETKGMINSESISKMKDGVIIINTCRGKVVIEEDLAGALKSRKVRAYGTDVWYSDPPDPSCPLLSAPNVLMAPHIGASSKENLLRIGDCIVDILKEYKS